MNKQMFVQYRRFEYKFEGFFECEIGKNIKETEDNIKKAIIEKHADTFGQHSVGWKILMVTVLN